jgi:hypothetical protein
MKKLLFVLLLLQSCISLAAELRLLVNFPDEGNKEVICHNAKAELGTGVTCSTDQGQTEFYPVARIIKIETIEP